MDLPKLGAQKSLNPRYIFRISISGKYQPRNSGLLTVLGQIGINILPFGIRLQHSIYSYGSDVVLVPLGYVIRLCVFQHWTSTMVALEHHDSTDWRRALLFSHLESKNQHGCR